MFHFSSKKTCFSNLNCFKNCFSMALHFVRRFSTISNLKVFGVVGAGQVSRKILFFFVSKKMWSRFIHQFKIDGNWYLKWEKKEFHETQASNFLLLSWYLQESQRWQLINPNWKQLWWMWIKRKLTTRDGSSKIYLQRSVHLLSPHQAFFK